MTAVNYLDIDNTAKCYVASTPTDLERFLYYLHYNSCTIVSVVPISRVMRKQAPYFSVMYSCNSVVYIDVFYIYDLHTLLSRNDISFMRILDYVR